MHDQTTDRPRVLRPDRDGLLVLSGYGLKIQVQRKHLVVEDGVGRDRRRGALHRATSGLKRIVVLGTSGYITFEALRFLADVGAGFVQIDTAGKIVASFAPSVTNDVARRRAQLAAATDATGGEIVQWLLAMKLHAQSETLARFQPGLADARAAIDAAATQLKAEDLDGMRWQEAVAASAYWSALAPLRISFPKSERSRLPEHWATIGPRTSPLTGRPRSAVTPFQAMLNYLYTILENEARIAISANALDPEIGLLHAERRSRASFAADLMEPLRPEVDRFLLDMVRSRTFSLRSFVEARDGHCRLTSDLARMLASTGPQWSSRLTAILEPVIRMLENGATSGRRAAQVPPTTSFPGDGTGRLHRRTTAQGRPVTPVMPKTVCVECGGALARGLRYCSACRGIQQRESVTAARPAAIATVAALRAEGQDPTHGGPAQQRRARTIAARLRAVQAAGGPARDAVATRKHFQEQIWPGLENVSTRALCEATGLSPSYWSLIKRGKRVPHRHHWAALRALGYGRGP